MAHELTLRVIGRRVLEARKACDPPLTQAQLAQRAGVAPNTVYRIEAGCDVRVSTLTAVIYAAGLHLDVHIPPNHKM